MTTLFVLRHGNAEAQAEKDSLRPLSLLGKEEIRTSLAKLQEEIKAVKQVFVSPYLRAQQSYEIAKEFLAEHKMETLDLLSPGAAPDSLMSYLDFHAQADSSVLLISHQPLVGTFVDLLCGLEQGQYRMGTAAIAHIQVDVFAASCAELLSLKHPV